MIGVLAFPRDGKKARSQVGAGVTGAVSADKDSGNGPETAIQIGRESKARKIRLDVWKLTFNAREIVKSANVPKGHRENNGGTEGVHLIDGKIVVGKIARSAGAVIHEISKAIETCRALFLLRIPSAE